MRTYDRQKCSEYDIIVFYRVQKSPSWETTLQFQQEWAVFHQGEVPFPHNYV